MTVRRLEATHNGVRYVGAEERGRQATGSITKGDRKWTLKGNPSIERTIGSYKHGDEVQVILWNNAGTTTERPRVRYATQRDRVEIFFPVELWDDLVREYYSHIRELRL